MGVVKERHDGLDADRVQMIDESGISIEGGIVVVAEARLYAAP